MVEGNAKARLRFRRDEVSGGFFQAAGTFLLRGRFFSAADGPEAPRVAILNEAMARHLWPGDDPVGRKLEVGPGGFPWVGVVGDMRRQGVENEPIPQMFEALAQNPPRVGTVLVRTSGQDSLRMAGAIRAAVRRFQAGLLSGFAAAALLIAAVGIYGLLQYSIATRTREIGIRLAVGAQGGHILPCLCCSPRWLRPPAIFRRDAPQEWIRWRPCGRSDRSAVDDWSWLGLS